MSDGYASHPMSVSELRADRTGSPADLKPRDVLIRVLREIDAGEIAPDHVFVVLGVERPEGAVRTTYHQGGSLNFYGQLGLLGRAHAMLQRS